MARALVAGCGYLGSATADLLHDGGWEVEGWTGSAASAAELNRKPYRVHCVDIADRRSVDRAATQPFDAIIQCASSRGGDAAAYRRIYLEGARNLLGAFASARFLFTSSTSVYAQRSGEWVDEESPAEPASETARVLREAEEVVLAAGGVVVRLAGLYGPGRSAHLRKFLAGEARLSAAGARFINQVHRDDAAAALVLLTQAPPDALPPPRIYNVTDNHPLSDRDCYAFLAGHFGRPLPPISSTSMPRKRGDSNKRVCSGKLFRAGWRPRYPTFAEGLRASVLPNLERCGA